jgi:phosphoribosylamine--glycine ligase
MAARGYPAAPEKGSVIEGVAEAAAVEGVEIFQAGTAVNAGALVANGGRVLNVTAIGSTVAQAQTRAYEAVDLIDWPQGFCRRDIGWRAVEREEQA